MVAALLFEACNTLEGSKLDIDNLDRLSLDETGTVFRESACKLDDIMLVFGINSRRLKPPFVEDT